MLGTESLDRRGNTEGGGGYQTGRRNVFRGRWKGTRERGASYFIPSFFFFYLASPRTGAALVDLSICLLCPREGGGGGALVVFLAEKKGLTPVLYSWIAVCVSIYHITLPVWPGPLREVGHGMPNRFEDSNVSHVSLSVSVSVCEWERRGIERSTHQRGIRMYSSPNRRK